MIWRTRHSGSVIPSPAKRRRGTILIVTMWILMALAGLVLVLGGAMRVEGGCSANGAAELQADAIEQGAVQYVLAHVVGLEGKVPTDTDMPCEAVRVGGGAFWIIRPNYDDEHTIAYGLVDEASKLNLNMTTGPLAVLSRLPGLDGDLASSILVWRRGGLEGAYYSLLSEPYQCKAAPFETVDELFLVKDMNRDILYGEDINQNGILDVNEDDAEAAEPNDNKDGKLNRGVAPFLTVYSSERNVTASGARRMNVNNIGSRNNLVNRLTRAGVSQERVNPLATRITNQRTNNGQFRNLFDFYYRSGMTQEEFAISADQFTTAQATRPVVGLVNINTAPREVLAALGLDDGSITTLLAARSETNAASGNIAWVVSALPRDKAQIIARFITARSYQFSADIVSVPGNGRAFRRCRIVVDASGAQPKIVYRQNLTRLGWPLDEGILAALRSGRTMDEAVAKVNTLTMSNR